LSVVAARARESSASDLESAMETHRELQLSVKKAVTDCTALKHQEKIMVEGLAAVDATD
jgi:hypothetical protein